jgi:outer membrane protein TolC
MVEIPAGLWLLVVLGFVPAVLMACGSIHFNPGTDVAPSDDPARVWVPPVSVANASQTTSRLDELRAVDLGPAQAAPAGNEYDLPRLVDVALRSNPQTRRAWYQARFAAAQYGQSHSNDYPKVAAEAEGGYLKLPLQFPGQPLVIRNEAFLPQVKVSYDLLDFGRAARPSAARASS